MNPISIFGLGTIVVDHQILVERFPDQDTKGEVLSDRYQVGGPVPTALCLLRRWGAQVTFQGKWASDRFGAMIETDLTSEGVAFLSPPLCSDSRSGFAHVWLEQSTGRRTIAAYRGSHEVGAEELCHRTLGRHAALHLDGWSIDAAILAAKSMRNSGGKVFLDLGSPKSRQEELLSEVDLVNCPSRFIQQVFGTDDLEVGAGELLNWGASEVTVTCGEQGAWYFTKSTSIHQPAISVDPVDTNGAGDVFSGAMIFGALQEWDGPQKLAFACAAAAIKCENLGNRTALPSFERVQETLQGSRAL